MAHKLMILARTGEGANGEGDIFGPERIVGKREAIHMSEKSPCRGMTTPWPQFVRRNGRAFLVLLT